MLGIFVALASFARYLTSPRVSLPKGKGLFIDDLVREGVGVKHLVAKLKWLGIKWLAVEIYWADESQDNTHNLEDGSLALFVPELRAAGIDVWVWGFPSPDRVPRFVELTKHAYDVAPGVAGVIIDPEKPFYGREYGPALEDLMSRLADLGKPVGVTSYGYPKFHPSFPWEAISGAAFGMPQVYSERGPDYPDLADDAWRDLGIDYIVPLNGASSAHRADDPDGFGLEEQAAASDTSDGAIGWWNYRHVIKAKDSGQKARAQFVRTFDAWGGDG